MNAAMATSSEGMRLSRDTGDLSNKQTAARLFISERTVDTHVGHILNKLGFNSRAQIAGWISARLAMT